MPAEYRILQYADLVLLAEKTRAQRTHRYTDEVLMEALTAVQQGKLSRADASKQYGIPCSTMSEHLSGHIKGTAARLGLVVGDLFILK